MTLTSPDLNVFLSEASPADLDGTRKSLSGINKIGGWTINLIDDVASYGKCQNAPSLKQFFFKNDKKKAGEEKKNGKDQSELVEMRERFCYLKQQQNSSHAL